MMQLDNIEVTQIVFHPRREPNGYSPTGIPTQTACNGGQVSGYLHVDQESSALLILFHGNGEIAADYDSLAPLYMACGVCLWVVDYRGYGRSSGTPSFTRMFTDAEAILRDVSRISEIIQKNFNHIIVMGRSLGSTSAIHLAVNYSSSLAGLILDSPYADGLALIHRLGGPKLIKPDLQGFEDNIDNMQKCNLPTLIIHGG